MTIRVWNLDGGGERRLIAAHSGIVNRLCYHPNGKILASCGKDGFVRLWDAANGRRLSAFSITETPVFNISNIAFSRDGKQIGAVDWNGGAAVFDISNPEKPQLSTTLLRGEFGALLWDITSGPNANEWAIAAHSGVRVWRADQPAVTVTDQGTLYVDWSPDGRRVAWTRNGDGQLGAWDLEASQSLRLESAPCLNSDVVFFPDSHHVLGHVHQSKDGRLGNYIVDLQSGQRLALSCICRIFRLIGV